MGDPSRILSFRVEGRPAPQGSKAYGAAGQMTEASRFLKAWRERVHLAALRARRGRLHGDWLTVDGPARVSMLFLLRRPTRPLNALLPIGPPDVDKLVRAVNDALTQAGVFVDDSRVVSLYAEKQWAADGEPTGCLIKVEAL